MDDDARRQKNASEAEASFKKGRDIILDQQYKEKEQQKTSTSLEQGQQERRKRIIEEQSLKKAKSSLASCADCANSTSRDFVSIKRNLSQSAKYKNKRQKLNNEIIHIIIYKQKKSLVSSVS